MKAEKAGEGRMRCTIKCMKCGKLLGEYVGEHFFLCIAPGEVVFEAAIMCDDCYAASASPKLAEGAWRAEVWRGREEERGVGT